MHMLSHINLSPAKSERLGYFNLFWFTSYNCVLSAVLHCQTFLGQNLLWQQAAGFSHLFYGLDVFSFTGILCADTRSL